MLHGALRFSDHPRARVLRIDTSKAEAHPGVVAVVTAADVPGERAQGTITQDWRQLVAEGEETAYVGDVLAAVAAETPPRRPRGGGARRGRVRGARAGHRPLRPAREGAPCSTSGTSSRSRACKRGDADAALAGAAHVVTETFRTQFIEHAFLEPEAALAVPDEDGGLHVYSQGQGVWDDRRQIASFLGLPEERVRVTQVSTGGAFGAKEDLNVQCHAALLASVTGRPGARHPDPQARASASTPSATRCGSSTRAGCDEEGHLLARPRADRRRHRRLRERRRQGARARRRPRLRRLQGAERRRRGDGRLHEQPAVRRDARLRRQPVELRDRGRARPARRAGRHRRLGDPLAQRARRGRPLLHRPAARPRRRPEADAARGARRLPRRALRRHRLRREEHRHRQRHARVRPRRSCGPRPTAR